MSDEPQLAVEHVGDTATVVAVTGEIDYHSSPVLRTGVGEVITEGHHHLILDMSGVSFCDSSGLSTLVGLWHRARAAGGSLTLTAVSDRLARLLRMTGLDQILVVDAGTEEALARLRGTGGGGSDG
ncbi:STAS domain-containing protein [Streptomyces sp. TRM 70361]|uniref:STAS domain-containing protein n=1 Tax=Streptomyces sp. TRM 70361 TaxID=3116553 RepID=UPI002E7B2162|nr:STAS domain-containing protein [Streptomyces sp. TRM 70361]MEE1942974.1 STAS domain-containing protein [Streptomyces sp. TRM 70361]